MRIVYGDSWFGKPDAAAALKKHGLLCVGQVKKQRYLPRGFPKSLLEKVLSCNWRGIVSLHGEHDGVSMYATGIKSRKPNLLIHTALTAIPTIEVTRIVKESGCSKSVTYRDPQVGEFYHRYKGKID